jgi:uncharacterized protein
MQLFILFILFISTLFSEQIKINNHKLAVEIADNEPKRQKGLQKRTSLNYSNGMLFIFDDIIYATFWMKNTYLDLSIGFFNDEKKLVQINKMPASKPYKLYKSRKQIKYALEVNMGWFENNNIQIGDLFTFD